jgi:hypothetical protein
VRFSFKPQILVIATAWIAADELVAAIEIAR